MREGLRTGDPKLLAAFEFPLPIVFIVDRRFEHSIGQRFAGAFRLGEELREHLLRAQLPARGIDGQCAHDRLCQWNRDLPRALAHLDRAISLLNDDFLESFLMRPGTLVARALGAAFWIARSPRRELPGFWWPAIKPSKTCGGYRYYVS